jgi:hypothetical protein
VSAIRLRLAVAPDLAPSCVLAPVRHPGSTAVIAPGALPGGPLPLSVVLRV